MFKYSSNENSQWLLTVHQEPWCSQKQVPWWWQISCIVSERNNLNQLAIVGAGLFGLERSPRARSRREFCINKRGVQEQMDSYCLIIWLNSRVDMKEDVILVNHMLSIIRVLEVKLCQICKKRVVSSCAKYFTVLCLYALYQIQKFFYVQQ